MGWASGCQMMVNGQLRESGRMANSMARQFRIGVMDIVENMRQRMESPMGNSSDASMMVVICKLSARTENNMEDGDHTTRMESSQMIQYGRMARG